MSDYAPPTTYYDPYSRTQKPVLTKAQVDGMWPNASPRPLDDRLADWPVGYSMPSIPKERPDRAAQAAVEHRMSNRPKGSVSGAELANILSAPERGVDMVNLPPHYARFKIEPIRFICENRLDFFQGNVVKYILRHDAKNGLEDIKKVIRYATMYYRFLSEDPDWWQAGKPEDFVPEADLKSIKEGLNELE